MLSLSLSMGLSGLKTGASTDGEILGIQRTLGKEQIHAMIFPDISAKFRTTIVLLPQLYSL